MVKQQTETEPNEFSVAGTLFFLSTALRGQPCKSQDPPFRYVANCFVDGIPETLRHTPAQHAWIKSARRVVLLDGVHFDTRCCRGGPPMMYGVLHRGPRLPASQDISVTRARVYVLRAQSGSDCLSAATCSSRPINAGHYICLLTKYRVWRR